MEFGSDAGVEGPAPIRPAEVKNLISALKIPENKAAFTPAQRSKCRLFRHFSDSCIIKTEDGDIIRTKNFWQNR